MVGVPRSRAIADCPTGRLALDKVKVDVLIEDVAGRVEFGGVAVVSAGLTLSATAVLLFLRVVTAAAPFKLFIRAEALLRGAAMRFLGGFASVDVSAVPGESLEPRPDAAVAVVLMLAGGDAKVDTPDAVSVVMDAPCDCEPLLVAFTQAAEVADGSPKEGVQPGGGDVTVLSWLPSLELISWRISGLFRRPCCCCSSVVVLTGAGSVFPK